MRVVFVVSFALLCVLANANPLLYENEERVYPRPAPPKYEVNLIKETAKIDESSKYVESKTVKAIKSFFDPFISWFTTKLPEKTPSELAGEAVQTTKDLTTWAQKNEVLRNVHTAIKPVQQWFQEKATNMKDRTFKDMYDDTKDAVKTLDEKIGNWINSSTKY